jgi:hypothetical protein
MRRNMLYQPELPYNGPKHVERLVVLSSLPGCGKSKLRCNLETASLRTAPVSIRQIVSSDSKTVCGEPEIEEFKGRILDQLVLEVDFSSDDGDKLSRAHFEANHRLVVMGHTDTLYVLVLWAPRITMLQRYLDRRPRRVPKPYNRPDLEEDLRAAGITYRPHVLRMYHSEDQRGILANHYEEWIAFINRHDHAGCWLVDTTTDPFTFVPIQEWDCNKFCE